MTEPSILKSILSVRLRRVRQANPDKTVKLTADGLRLLKKEMGHWPGASILATHQLDAEPKFFRRGTYGPAKIFGMTVTW